MDRHRAQGPGHGDSGAAGRGRHQAYPRADGLPTLSQKIWSSTKETTQLDLYPGGWSASTGDADWALRPLLYGPSGPPAAYNPGYYDNPDLNKLIEAGLNTVDESKRDQAYADAQKLIWEDSPWVFPYVPQNITAVRKGVTGAYIQGDGILNLRDVAMG